MTLDPQALTAAAEAYRATASWPIATVNHKDALSAAITAYQAETNKKRISGAHKIAMAVRDIEEGNLATVHFNGQTWRPEPQWQDISTAPKDRPIFLWGYLECSALSRPHVGSDDRYEAIWHAEFKAWQAINYGGWIVEPSHWHPTPEPPLGSGRILADANSKSPIQAREE